MNPNGPYDCFERPMTPAEFVTFRGTFGPFVSTILFGAKDAQDTYVRSARVSADDFWEAVQEEAITADKRLPENWKEPRHPRVRESFFSLAPKQLGFLRNVEPLTYEKAVIGWAAIEGLFEKQGLPAPQMQLRATHYAIDDLSDAARALMRNEINGAVHTRLVTALLQDPAPNVARATELRERASEFLLDVANGHTGPHGQLAALTPILDQELNRTHTIIAAADREGKKKRPARGALTLSGYCDQYLRRAS